MATQRIVALVDMDCFYCQVEARLDPTLKGKPSAVVQYNQWKGGGIIAVNYEARDQGVTRHMRGAEAKAKCPNIVLVSVPCVRGKADLTKYRDAGSEVIDVFCRFSDCVQRASIDEAYIDITKVVDERIKNGLTKVQPEDLPTTFVVGHCDMKTNEEEIRANGTKKWLVGLDNEGLLHSSEFRLAVGGVIIEEMRAEILNKTGFHCSAGIAHNKILAKLAAGLHKPKRQTILPHDSVPELYETLPLNKVRSLGGKMGKVVTERLDVKFMSELYHFTQAELQQKIDDKTGSWLYNMARGIDFEPVTPRIVPDTIGCCKNFPGAVALSTRTAVQGWVKELASEIAERLAKDLEKNKRRARTMTVSFSQETAMSRSASLTSYTAAAIADDAMTLLNKFNNCPPSSDAWNPPLKYLGISVGKFIEEQTTIGKFLQPKLTAEEIKSEAFLIEKKDKINQSGTSVTMVESTVKTNRDQSPTSTYFKTKENTSAESKSFFLSFLKRNKEACALENNSSDLMSSEGGKESNDDAWISLSEVIPDITDADEDVVDMLPEVMRSKLEARRLEMPGPSEPTDSPTEVCSECRKKIPLEEFPEHNDYHVAMKLQAQFNNHTQVLASSGKATTVPSPKKGKRGKRKAGKTSTNGTEKKMKNITSFFSVVSK